MALQIIYKSQLKALTGVSEEQVSLPSDGVGLANVFQLLVEKHISLNEVLLPEGSRNPSVIVFLNNKQVSVSNNPLVSSKDSLILMSPIAGG